MAEMKTEHSRMPDSDPLQEQRKKTLRAAGLMLLPFAVCLYLIFGRYVSDITDSNGGLKSLPEGRGGRIEANKQKAIEQVSAEQNEQQRSISLDADGFSLLAKKPQEQSPHADQVEKSRSANREATRLMADFYAPKADPQVEALRKQVEELQEQLALSPSTKEDPLEIAERQYALAAKYLKQEEPMPEPVAIVERATPVFAVHALSNNTVSSLAAKVEDPPSSAEQPERNIGFHTPVGSSTLKRHNTLRVCVDENQTLSSGDRIRLRLTEPASAGSILLPAGELIFGTVSIAGQRMQVTVTGIEKDGTVLTVALDAYDLDGGKGLFVPDSAERAAAKEAAASIGAGLGSGISFTTNAGQQVAMDLVRGALTGGTQYIASKLRQVKVKVKAGYQLLLVSKQ